MNPGVDQPVVAEASGGLLSSEDVKEIKEVADYATKMEGGSLSSEDVKEIKEVADYATKMEGGSLSSENVKEIKEVADYATRMEDEAQKLFHDFDEMGLLRRIWDSKVPDNDKRFYYFFTFKPTNREEAQKEIQKYLDFYKTLKSGMDSVRGSGEARQDGEKLNVHLLILDLNEQLKQMHKEAETGISWTGSSSVYEMHKSFVDKHEKLRSMIKRVECVALKEDLRRVKDECKEAVKSIKTYQVKLVKTQEKLDDVCNKFEDLKLQNESMQEQQINLMNSNKELEQLLQTLLEENATIKSILTSLANNERSSIPN